MAAAGNNQETIYEKRYEKIVSRRERDGETTVRIARFLKPIAKQQSQAAPIPNTLLLFHLLPHNQQQWPSEVVFRGWNCPQKRWKEWYNKLSKEHSPIWKQTGIFEAIKSSTYEIRCNKNIVLGLSEFWCSHTNTFVFPWGEATVTLEDVVILGGFPVLGDPFDDPILIDKLEEVVAEMNGCRTKVQRGKSQKAAHSEWIKHFIDDQRDHEHVAFLSLWLSRYVFPGHAHELIEKTVFPIAAKLSSGIKLALAPVVLANLYHNLTKLTKEAMAAPSDKIQVLGLFQLLQIWAVERFPVLFTRKIPTSVQPGEPRVARWGTSLNFPINLPLVRSALRDPENFQWRPYAAELENWQYPSYYPQTEKSVVKSSGLDDDLKSFLICLQTCELVGVDCREKYLPQRVANQFGMDQDLPGGFSGSDSTDKFVRFFIPSRSFQPGMSAIYSHWWKGFMSNRSNAMKGAGKGDLQHSETLFDQRNGTNEKGHTPVKDDNSSHQKEFGNGATSKQIICLSDDDDDDDDDLPIETCMHSPPKAADSFASNIDTEKKRNLSCCGQENFQDKVASKGVAKKVKVEEDVVSSKNEVFLQKVKEETVDQSIDSHKKRNQSAEVPPQNHATKAGSSESNPIDLDEDSEPMRNLSNEDLRIAVKVFEKLISERFANNGGKE